MHRLSFFLVLLLCFCSSALAAEFHVSTQAEFMEALTISAANGQDDRILVLDGAAVSSTTYDREPGHSLEIVGAFAADFTSRVRQPNLEQALTEEASRKTGAPQPHMSTTGPTPSDAVEAKPAQATSVETLAAGGVEKVLGVPGYLWRHGCGPTAGGMLLGYYDIKGFSDLFEGSASTQTDAVDQGIASEHSTEPYGHYEDYSLPLDSTGELQEDKSQLGGAHTSDSLGDFMRTSWSVDGMRYGWSYSNYVATGVVDYTALRNSGYTVTMTEYYMGGYSSALTWDVLMSEIDAGRPMIFLVDSNADGNTDHFVTVVGYRDGDTREYGCLDTWEPVSTVRWCEFAAIASGQPWGVWGGVAYTFGKPDASVVSVPATVLLLD